MATGSRSFTVSQGADDLEWTGERYLPEVGGDLRAEHLHRYLFALQYCADKAVLDVACGEGYGSALLAQTARTVVGVDIAEDVVKHASSCYGDAQISFAVGDCQNIPLPDHSVDVVVCFETIEHVADQSRAIAEMKRVLRPDGAIIMSTPDANSDDGAWHEGNPYHVHEMSNQEFAETLRANFRHAWIAGQSAVHGSVILEGSSSAEVFTAQDEHAFARREGAFAASYQIAVASDQEPRAPQVSLLMDPVQQQAILKQFDWAVSQMRAREHELAALRADIQRLIDLTSDDALLQGDRLFASGDDAEQAIRDPGLTQILTRLRDLNDARALAARHAGYLLRHNG